MAQLHSLIALLHVVGHGHDARAVFAVDDGNLLLSRAVPGRRPCRCDLMTCSFRMVPASVFTVHDSLLLLSLLSALIHKEWMQVLFQESDAFKGRQPSAECEYIKI